MTTSITRRLSHIRQFFFKMRNDDPYINFTVIEMTNCGNNERLKAMLASGKDVNEKDEVRLKIIIEQMLALVISTYTSDSLCTTDSVFLTCTSFVVLCVVLA